MHIILCRCVEYDKIVEFVSEYSVVVMFYALLYNIHKRTASKSDTIKLYIYIYRARPVDEIEHITGPMEL